MTHASRWTILVAIVAAAAGVSCRHDRKADQLAALERGHAAGVLTQSEYDAKKAQILGVPVATQSAPVPETPPPPPVEATPPYVPPPVPAPPPAPVSARRTIPKPVAEAPAPPPESVPAAPPPPVQAPARPAAEPPEAAGEPAPIPGCSDAGSKPGKEKGRQERFFPMPVARVKAAAIAALEALDFKVNNNDGDEIEATRKRRFGVIGSGGEKVILSLEPSQQNGQRGTLVAGETKKGILGRVGQKSWTNAVLTQTGCILQRGR